MKRFMLSMIAAFCMTGTAHAAKRASIFPKNDRWIGVGFVDQGITEQQFNQVLDRMVAVYEPIVAKHGYKLDWIRLWDDGTVNSDTYTDNGKWVINAYGGLARYSGMTMDGYAAVACHELGHHLGGAPLYNDGSRMSVEGESDYHVGTKCLRKYFAQDDNVRVMSGVPIDPLVVARCSVAFVGDAEQIAICERSALAGFQVADVLRDLEGATPIAFNTPDNTVVKSTDENHPHAQCRLDTYFASAVCPVSDSIEFDLNDVTVGSCMTGEGARPRCWFAR